jgi:prepilin-type N-terminal cleavage/methylation domain-containing protein
MRGGQRAATGSASAARGFTLVEILVALVVLMIGIYAMLRIFPRGFSAIELSQQQTTAAQLAEAELARWRLHPESLPDAIVATDYDGNLVDATLVNNSETLTSLLVYGELAAQIPGSTNYGVLTLPRGEVQVGNLDFFARPFIYSPMDVTPSQFDAALAAWPSPGAPRPATRHPNWQPNSLYLPRTVLGEQIDVRGLALNQEGVPFHLLSHAPLDRLLENDPATRDDDVYIIAYDAERWEYLPGAALGQRQFGVQATATETKLYFGPTALPPTEDRVFKVDYTDPVTNLRVLGIEVWVAANSTEGNVVLPGSVDPLTMQVHESLVELTSGEYQLWRSGNWDAWPRNRYYLFGKESTISGEVQFAPALQLEPEKGDIRLVKMDYRVKDWGILVFDVEVPPGGMVRLPVQGIKGPNTTNPPRQPRPEAVDQNIKKQYDWDGMVTLPTDPRSSWAYVVAVDRQTGDILTEHEGTIWPANPYMRRSRFLADYRNGLLYFNYDPRNPDIEPYFNELVDTPNRSGRTYRIFCRAEKDWAVQLMVAARQYARSADRFPGTTAMGAEEGAGGLTYAWTLDRPNQLYFPLSEAGQAVMVDYVAADGSYVGGEVHTIGSANITDLGQWTCPLADRLEKTPYRIIGVRGIGVRARALWVTPGRDYTLQELARAIDEVDTLGRPGRPRPVVGESWRQLTISTYITRAPI